MLRNIHSGRRSKWPGVPSLCLRAGTTAGRLHEALRSPSITCLSSQTSMDCLQQGAWCTPAVGGTAFGQLLPQPGKGNGTISSPRRFRSRAVRVKGHERFAACVNLLLREGHGCRLWVRVVCQEERQSLRPLPKPLHAQRCECVQHSVTFKYKTCAPSSLVARTGSGRPSLGGFLGAVTADEERTQER